MSDHYSMTQIYRLERCDETGGNRTPTGHEVDAFHSMPVDNLEDALRGFYMTMQRATGCGDDEIPEKAASILSRR